MKIDNDADDHLSSPCCEERYLPRIRTPSTDIMNDDEGTVVDAEVMFGRK